MLLRVEHLVKILDALIAQDSVTEWKKDFFLCTRVNDAIVTLRKLGLREAIETQYQKTQNKRVFANWKIKEYEKNIEFARCLKEFLKAFNQIIEYEKALRNARAFSLDYRNDKDLLFVLIDLQKKQKEYLAIYNALLDKTLDLKKDLNSIKALGNIGAINKECEKNYRGVFNLVNQFKGVINA